MAVESDISEDKCIIHSMDISNNGALIGLWRIRTGAWKKLNNLRFDSYNSQTTTLIIMAHNGMQKREPKNMPLNKLVIDIIPPKIINTLFRLDGILWINSRL